MDESVCASETRRRHRNWVRRQRRKAARERVRLRCLTYYDETAVINDPLASDDAVERARAGTDSQRTADLRRIDEHSSLGISVMPTLNENLVSEGLHTKASNSADGSNTSSAPRKDANCQENSVRRRKLVEGIHKRIRRLEKLQELRKCMAAIRRTGLDAAASARFTEQAETLKARLSDLLVDLGESSEMANVGRQLTKTKLNDGKSAEVRTNVRIRDIEVALFGSRRYNALREEDELIDIRRQWDAYENIEGQTIPVRWVEPPEKPTEEWAEYLVL
ncbi:mitochondrial tRNA-specific 2-thiouridylase 1-like [Tropilaelaps mercedesae]|uniref:Mitochondrial tRNA-specific 2-thiouridylase 1-like n=1 Tax=Tropilaelaps mercedesae TaxID=418985 RepID=A0A1V9X266_9ACAR|nr:mitochondrial tRNA-specific 2-thiouridylase 1-like [Tropilaelaps mercedesae]